MLENLVDEFLTHLRVGNHYSACTLESYGLDLRQFLHFLAEQQIDKPEAVDHIVLRRFLASLKQASFAKSSISRKLACLRTFFKFLCRQGYLEENPLL